MNAASIDLEIRARILPTYSGSPGLKYFDGATKSLYQIPTKPFEVNYCRQSHPPIECQYLQGYDPNVFNAPESHFEVKTSKRGVDKRGLFAKVDIPQGAMIIQEKSSNSIQFYPTTTNLIYHTAALNPDVKKMLAGIFKVFDSYAFENNLFVSTKTFLCLCSETNFFNLMKCYALLLLLSTQGTTGYDIHSSILSSVNHGCNGTHNIAADPSYAITELTADPSTLPSVHYSKGSWENVFNPVVERHLPHRIGGYDIAVRDISTGEEILDNYLASVSTAEDWAALVSQLRSSCEAERRLEEEQTCGN